MPGERDVIDLAERKRQLVLEADLHRTALRAELASARARLEWLHEARDKVGAAGPWLALGAGVFGVLAARRWRNVLRWVPTALTALRWIRKLKTEG